MKISEFKIGAPAARALEAAKISTLKQLSMKTEADITAMHGVGAKAVGILRDALEAEGLSFETGHDPVDVFIAQNVQPKLRPVVDAIRALYAKAAPKAVLKIAYGLPMWDAGGSLVSYISPSKSEIKLSFTFGAGFEDKHGKLQGKAKHARYVRLRTVEDIDEKVLRCYIKQAIATGDPL